MTASNLDDHTHKIFLPIWEDATGADDFPNSRPLLAHYCSMQSLERIMKTSELWFSNPLFMNDLEELRFGLGESLSALRQHDGIRKACGDPDRYRRFLDMYEVHHGIYDAEHAFDTYIFCFSEHLSTEVDGLLSMWRGYGGNATGAAIVFDTGRLNVNEYSPFIVAKVTYASREQRIDWIGKKLDQFAAILSANQIPVEHFPNAAQQLFERFKMFSLFTKHVGFNEEREWRAVYLRERDVKGYCGKMLDYALGPHGIEPKLKLKIHPIAELTANDFFLQNLVRHIILGPSVSSMLHKTAVIRMLELAGKPNINVLASTTPYRSTSS